MRARTDRRLLALVELVVLVAFAAVFAGFVALAVAAARMLA